jgi:methyl-accepting chemotaxis protein
METYKRRNYFIDKGAQSRFIIGFVLSSLFGGIIGVSSFVYFARQKIDSTLYSMRLPELAAGDLLMPEMLLTIGITSIFVLVLFALAARKGIKRIDGPLSKMAGVIRQIGKGHLQEEIRLREKDEFKSLAEELDGMAGNMRSRFLTIRRSAGQIKELSSTGQEMEERKKILHCVSELKKEIGVFKV